MPASLAEAPPPRQAPMRAKPPIHIHRAAQPRFPFMSDNPNLKGAADRSRVATGEDYEVRYFVETMRKEFPEATTEQIESALMAARAATGTSSREVLTTQVRAILGAG